MTQRIALFLASLAATAVLVVGLSAAGIGAGTGPALIAAPVLATTSAPTDAASTPQVQVDTVYVDPPQKPATVIVHKTAPATGGEHESEGGD